MRMFQVDAFTDRLFAGNPAAVLVLDDWLPDDLMLKIAAENNLAETAFTRPRPDGGWDLRWCTPAMEVDFCGHATLATAHILFTEYAAPGPLVFHTRIGPLRVDRGDAGYLLDLPCLPPKPLTPCRPRPPAVSPPRQPGSSAISKTSLPFWTAPRPFAPSSPTCLTCRGWVGRVWSSRRRATAVRTSPRVTSCPARASRKIRSPALSMPRWCRSGRASWGATG